MKQILLSVFLLFTCLCLQASSINSSPERFLDVDDHLNQYPKVERNSHDNIADIVHTHNHSHSHKHSENGEEHDHHHHHKKGSSQEAKLLCLSEFLGIEEYGHSSKSGFREITLLSSPFPGELFRPPIV